MKRTIYLYISLFCLPFCTWASHIVGGEIQFYVTNNATNRYYIALDLYFDVANGRTQAEDQTVKLFFFRKSDNQAMGNIELPQTTRKLINYSNPNCNAPSEDLQTRLIIYSGEIVMNPSNFNDAEGYYIVWERCCRNMIVNNIVSPASTGATFYLQFPPLSITNSSPRFTELKGDYICYNRNFSFEFGGKDPDGDSLVYSLAVPYNSFSRNNSGAAAQATGSSNYPEVVWTSGVNLQNVIPGSPPLRVHPVTGQLTVKASQRGLYVFCIMIEEFRNNKKIGFVRREFQLKVVDCTPNDPPVALFREIGKKIFYKEGETIRVAKDQAKCFEFLFTDPDVGQRLTITSKALNFDDKAVQITPAVVQVKSKTDTLKSQICLEKCVESRTGLPQIFEVIVTDEACPQGLTDTLRVRMVIEPLNNNKPKATTTLPTKTIAVVQENTLAFNVLGTDTDNDDIILEARPRGFQLAAVGMSFVNSTGTGAINQPFSWKTTCTTLTNRDYVIDFIVTDISCNRQTKDTITITIRATPKVNRAPDLTSSLPTNTITVSPPTDKYRGVSFDVFSDDLDKDPLTLTAQGRGFTLSKYQMKFTDKAGAPKLSSKFEWLLECKTIAELSGKTLTVDFFTEDASCAPKRDTLTVVFKIQDLPGSGTLPDQVPNVITPNGDGKNDCFMVENLTTSLCGPQFERVVIANRWGKRVFESEFRDFQWCGDGLAGGQYFYTIFFSDRNYKGILNVLR
jgi:gliding motility-associated-like protein